MGATEDSMWAKTQHIIWLTPLWTSLRRQFFDLQNQYFLHIANLELSQANINEEKMQRFCYLLLVSIIKDFRSS